MKQYSMNDKYFSIKLNSSFILKILTFVVLLILIIRVEILKNEITDLKKKSIILKSKIKKLERINRNNDYNFE
jgi:hypothetical protein